MCTITKTHPEKKAPKGEWGDGGSSTIVSSHVTSVPVLAEFSFMRQRKKCANVKTLPLTFCNASATTRTRSNKLTIQKPELIVKLTGIKEELAGPGIAVGAVQGHVTLERNFQRAKNSP